MGVGCRNMNVCVNYTCTAHFLSLFLEKVLANTECNRSLGVVYLGQGGQLSNGFLHKYVRNQYSFTVISTRYSESSMRESNR